jgi:predicted outer membrane repeat protein
MRAQLLTAFALCTTRLASGAGAAVVSSFPELEQTFADQTTTSISVANPFIQFSNQLDVVTRLITLTTDKTVEAAAVLSGGYSTRLFFLHSYTKLQLRNLHLTRGDCTEHQFGSGGVIYVGPGAELIMNSVSITASRAERGGAVYAIGSSSVIAIDCMLDSNDADAGGAFFVNDAVVDLSSCTMTSNSADWGGAVYVSDLSTVTAAGCVMSTNTAFWGGGLYAQDDSTIIATECTMNANVANGGGGAVSATDDSNVTATECTMSSNSAHSGGAIYTAGEGTIFAVSGCLLTSNFAQTGGALETLGSVIVTLSDCVIKLNRAAKVQICRCRPLYDDPLLFDQLLTIYWTNSCFAGWWSACSIEQLSGLRA